MAEKLLTATEVASRMEVKVSMVRLWTHRGILPYIKVKGRFRYSWQEIRQNLGEIRPELTKRQVQLIQDNSGLNKTHHILNLFDCLDDCH